MITDIIDQGNTIRLINQDKLDNGADEIYDLEKTSGIKIKYLSKENFINIWDEARRMFFTIKHEEVKSPTSINTEQLYYIIAEMINTPINVGIKDINGNTAKVDNSRLDITLNELLEEQRLTNKLLRKIYNPD